MKTGNDPRRLCCYGRVMIRPLQAMIDLVLPPRCPGCRTIVDGDGRFCSSCWQALRFITAPICARCGTPFEIDPGPAAECGACLAEPPHYGRARSALIYGGPARTVLLALKHGDRQYLAKMMATHMARAGAGLPADAERRRSQTGASSKSIRYRGMAAGGKARRVGV